jgi:hypothetical protein
MNDTSPLESVEWLEKLTARVMTASYPPLLHGYNIEGDLARYYSFAETAYLAITGVCPTIVQGRAFDAILIFASWAPINEAPTHAAHLARVCAGTTSSIQSVAAIALAEQARCILDIHQDWLTALNSGSADEIGKEAVKYPCTSETEHASVLAIRRAFSLLISGCHLHHDVSRTATIIAAFHALGLRERHQIERTIVLAKMTSVVAEALAAHPGRIMDYPTLLPNFEYDPVYQESKRDLR